MSSVLVTGGAGFIGSNLCRSLLTAGHTVEAVDNFITGTRENIETLAGLPNFSFHELDITDSGFSEVFSDRKFDLIYHLACPTGVPNLVTLAEEMIRTCSLGTLHILELARKHNAKLLFTSSAEVYGDPLVFPQTEEYTGNADPIGPRSAYEEGKRFSESCIAMYARKYGVRASIVRVFNTYGPGMSLDDMRVIPQFIRSVRDKKQFVVYGDGSQTRAHLYIDDLLAGFELVMEKGAPGEAYNIGSEHPMSIKELADMVISMTGHQEGVLYKPHFIADHGGRQPSTEKVKRLGWTQHVSIEEGLQRMIRAYLPTLA